MKDIEQVVTDIVEARYALSRFYTTNPTRPVPGPPTSAKELHALDDYLNHRGLSFPPSYRVFLAAHDGIRDFAHWLNLRKANEIRDPVDASLVNDFPTLSEFVIALGNTPAFISFDPETADASGEMEVVWVADDGAERRYPNFAAFLRVTRDELLEAVESEKADRIDLSE